jgi:hypothetical protein
MRPIVNIARFWIPLVVVCLVAAESHGNPVLAPPAPPHQLLKVLGLLLAEVGVACLLLRRQGLRMSLFGPALLGANLITWTVFYRLMNSAHFLHVSFILSLVVLEIAVTLLEARAMVVFARMARMQRSPHAGVVWRQALIVSAVVNVLSFAAGFSVLWVDYSHIRGMGEKFE